MFTDFNTITAKAPYIYRRNPAHTHSFMILRHAADRPDYVPVGDYTVLDQSEDPAVSEKKLINLMTLLNGGDGLIELGEQTKSRLLYHVVPQDDQSKTKIVFYALGEQGVSRENAVLHIEGGFDHETQ